MVYSIVSPSTFSDSVHENVNISPKSFSSPRKMVSLSAGVKRSNAIGASFTGVIVIKIIAVSDKVPSVALNVKLSKPL